MGKAHEDVSRCESLTDAMHQLGQDIHWEVLACVAFTSRTVSEIADELELDLTTVSKSLKKLRSFGLVRSTRAGVHHYQSVNSDVVMVRSPTEVVARLRNEHGETIEFVVNPVHQRAKRPKADPSANP